MNNEYIRKNYYLGSDYLSHFIGYIINKKCMKKCKISLPALITLMVDEFNARIINEDDLMTATDSSTKIMLAAYSEKTVDAGKNYAGHQILRSVARDYVNLCVDRYELYDNLDFDSDI
jgi:hypothetical protein